MAQRTKTDGTPEFTLSVEWPSARVSGAEPVLDASLGRIGITVRDTPVTAYKRDRGDTGTTLTIPLYDVAEWIALNWWPLLFEPQKGDQSEDDPDFRDRHWLGTARHGFALPDLWFLPAGNKLELSAESVYLRFARLTFTEPVNESVPLLAARTALAQFVDDVVGHITDRGIRETQLHYAWNLVRETPPDEEQYCRLIGALGLSPYEEHDEIDNLLDKLSDSLDERILADLFQASDVRGLARTSDLAERISVALSTANEVDIRPLADIDFPDDHAAQAWRWGVEATRNVRTHFGISNFDPTGGATFFEQLGLDPTAGTHVAADETIVGQVSAAIERRDASLRVVLAGAQERQRRFAAARAAFLGWSTESGASRLVTRARTREQQASRAFAAEMLAPIAYIRRNAGGGTISAWRIEELADDLGVAAQVVQYQAQNNGINVWAP